MNPLALLVATSTVVFSPDVCVRYRQAALTFEAAAMACAIDREAEAKASDIEVRDLEARVKACEDARHRPAEVVDDDPWYGGPLAAVALIAAFAIGVGVGVAAQ